MVVYFIILVSLFILVKPKISCFVSCGSLCRLKQHIYALQPDVIQGWQTSNFLCEGHWRTLSPAQENSSRHAALRVPPNTEVLYAFLSSYSGEIQGESKGAVSLMLLQ